MKRKITDHGNYKTVWYGDSWDKNGILETPKGFVDPTQHNTCVYLNLAGEEIPFVGYLKFNGFAS